MGAVAGLAQVENGAPCDHFAPVTNERIQDLLQVKDLRLAVDQGNHVDTEYRLHRGQLVQVV